MTHNFYDGTKYSLYISCFCLGIARGSGWQHIGAYVTLGAFYLFGIPAAVVLGFPLHMKAKGLWIGIVIGSVIQSTSLSLITGLTDWRKQVWFLGHVHLYISFFIFNVQTSRYINNFKMCLHAGNKGEGTNVGSDIV